jgi:O-antigen/teichoic acid export membrane protein
MASPSKNIAWLTISRVVALGLLFVAYQQLFRYLGPFASGQYQFVLSFVTIFGIVIDFGIQQYVIKKMSEDTSQVKRYFQTFVAVEVVLSVAVYGALMLVTSLADYDPQVKRGIALAGLGIVLNGLCYPYLAVMSTYVDLKKVAGINLLSSVVNAAMIFLAIAFHRSFVFIAAQQIIAGGLSLGIYHHLVRRYIGRPEALKALWSFDAPLMRRMLIAAIPFALLVGFSTLYNRLDVVLISHVLGYEQTGLYTAAYKFFDLISFFPAVISHSLYPVFAALLSQGNIGDARRLLERYLRLLIAVAIPLGVGGSLLAGNIIALLAGPQFAQAGPILAVLVWAPAILCVYIVVNTMVISQLTKRAMVITGINVLVNVTGNILLLPRFGIVAAAIMTLVCESLQAVAYFYFVRTNITTYRFWRFFPRPLIAAFVMGVVVYFVRGLPLPVAVVTGAAVYAGMLVLLGFFKPEDYAVLKQWWRNRTTARAVTQTTL